MLKEQLKEVEHRIQALFCLQRSESLPPVFSLHGHMPPVYGVDRKSVV